MPHIASCIYATDCYMLEFVWFKILKTHEVLADALKKLDKIDEAMSAAVDCYLQDELNPLQAVVAWDRIMCKVLGDEKCNTQHVKYVICWVISS